MVYNFPSLHSLLSDAKLQNYARVHSQQLLILTHLIIGVPYTHVQDKLVV
jgi:hypothetical protein